MARGRLVSKSLGSSRKFHALLGAGGKLGEFCQVLFPLIVANTDDFGRMPGDAFTVKNVVLPSSKRPESDFESALHVLAKVGLLVRYVADDSIYLQINKFDEHQPNLHKRTKSHFPEIPESPGPSEIYRPNLTEFKRTESKRTEQNPEPATRVADTLFETFWASYPKKKAKEDARKAWDKRRPDEALLALMLGAIAQQRQSPDWLRDGMRYVPNPATWLTGARWTDVIPADTLLLSDAGLMNSLSVPDAVALIEQNAHRKDGTHGH